MMLEIHGDVWLASEVIAVCLDEPSEGEPWGISLRVRGVDDWQIYDMDSEEQAKRKHIELVAAWKRALEDGR